MTSQRRRPGIFEGLPRVLYRRAGARYLEACAVTVVLNSVVVAGFGVATLALYVDLSAAELAALAAGWAAAFAFEGAAAAIALWRTAPSARGWLAGTSDEPHAWAEAVQVPIALARRPSLYAVGALAAAVPCLVLAGLLELPVREAALLFPMAFLLVISAAVLRYLALDFEMRPLLEAIGAVPPDGVARVSLHARLLAAVPMVNWGTGLVVAGLLTDDRRDLDTIALASIVSVGVTVAVATWLSFVLADAVSGPIVDLRDATRRVGAGDLDVRVPVVSTDETGELAASFNAMVAGLGERERLRDAFGAFVDPALTERVLAEGTDLHGEELEISVFFLDVRGFTAYTERAAAHEVVASLNALYEAVVPLILRHGGHANKFIGDGLLAVFGAPERHADHAARAVAAAREIADLQLDVGVGVNTGRVVVGTIGGGGRRDFTVIGDPVNTAARVEAATRLTGDAMLITEATLRALGAGGEAFEERPAMPLKGKTETVRLFAPRA